MKNKLFLPNNKEQIKTIVKYGFNSFVLPLENYSVGFETYFTLEEIDFFSKENEIYLMLNKLLHSDQIDSAINLLSSLNNVKGFIIEDLGLINNLKDKNVILFQNHLNMNYDSINAFYKLGIKNIVISNELTIKEINEIRNKTASQLYYFIIGKNHLMYSRRKLISNYNKHFKKENLKTNALIKEVVSNHELLVMEKDNTTSILDNNIFSGYSKLKELEKQNDYFIYNFSFLNQKDIKTILDNIEDENLNDKIKTNDYFLHNEITYKVKED